MTEPDIVDRSLFARLAALPGLAGVQTTGQRPLLWMTLKFAVTGTLLALVLQRVNLAAVLAHVRSASPAMLAAATGLFLLSPLLGGLRWWLVIGAMGSRVRVVPVTISYWSGVIFAQVLPAIASDGVRIWMLTRQHAPLRTVVHSVIVERAFMLGVLLCAVVATQPLLLHRVGPVVPPWLGPVLLAAGIAGGLAVMAMGRIAEWAQGFRLLKPLVRLAADIRQVVLSARIVPVLLLSLAANFNFVLAAQAVGASLGLSLSLMDYLAFMPCVVVATILPISVNGWGVREGILVAFLATVGVPAQTALAFSLLYGACSIFSTLLGLPLWWFSIAPLVRGTSALAE
jgi:uncharacterized membrane protein YbhN (UPF0104 family)